MNQHRVGLRNASDWTFAIRSLALGAVIVGTAWFVGYLGLSSPLSYAGPLAASLILGAGYRRWPVESLLVLAVVVVFYDTLSYYGVGAIKQLDEFSVVVVGLVSLPQAARSWRSWLWLPRDVAFAGIVLAGLASTVAHAVPLTIAVPALFLVVKPIAFLYIATWTPFDTAEVRSGMRAILVVAAVVAVLGATQAIFPEIFSQLFHLPTYDRRALLPSLTSVLIRPGLFGWLTTFVALFLFAAFSITRRWQWLALALFFSLGPILSARRRAILSLLVALGAGIAAALPGSDRRQVIRAWWPVGASVAILLVVFLPLFLGLYHYTLQRYGINSPSPSPVVSSLPPSIVTDDDDPPARVALYQGALKIASADFPLGAGLGRYASWMSRVNYSPLYAEYGLSDIPGLRPGNPTYVTDTFWPQILGELGVVGFIAYASFLASLGYLLWQESRRADEWELKVLRLGAGMVFAQALVESLANAMFHSPPRVYLVFLVVGAVASIRSSRASPIKAGELRSDGSKPID